mgnify:CR=1 FL=1
MTLGQKLKEIRKNFGLSQEDLADMMHVSRQAITKWENDNGMPDVSNLQELSKIFGITVDYFLDNEKQLPALSMRIELNKDDYKNQISMYSEVLKKYFKDCEIYILVRNKKMNFIDTLIDTFTIPWLGPVETADALSDLSPYYLVKKGNLKYLVNIKNYVLEVIELPMSTNEKKFIYGKNSFRNTGKIKL